MCSSNNNIITARNAFHQFIIVVILLVASLQLVGSRSRPGLRSREASPQRSRLNQCCNVAGILNPNTACTSSTCNCKANVRGTRCDECKEGFYNLDIENPDGCSECYCFGATHVCGSSNYSTTVIRSMGGWLVSDLPAKKVVEPTVAPDGHLIIANDELPGINNYYWDAPADYLGQKLYSYGGDLRFVLSYVVARGDTSGVFTEDADIILRGGPKDLMIGYNWKKPTREEEGKTVINLPLREQGWFKVDEKGRGKEPVSREEFTLITYNLKRMLIRAKFHTDQIEGGLHSLDMDLANRTSPNPKIAIGTEMCDCPEGYAGLSCELCAPGYRRVNNTLVNGKCVKCDCNNHAPSCDPYTGKCSVCLHHTTGEKCDRCEYGYYGDPTRGTPDDCKRCACPLLPPSNNFSPTCYLSESTPGGYICDACPKGYIGDRCDRCAEGFYGNPTVLGDYCKPCDCGPNANTSIPGWCDHRTGACLRCKGTIDTECKKCPPRHVLTPEGCKPCNDPCVDMMLDDIASLSAAANEANLTGIKDLPKIRLAWMSHRINKTTYDLHKYQLLIAGGQRVLQNVTINFDLEALADILYLKAKDMESRGHGVNKNAIQTGIDAEELLDFIHDLLDELNRVIDGLRRYGFESEGFVATDRILMEAERILRELLNRNLVPSLDAAERELRKAKHLLDRVKSLVASPATSHGLQERLDRLRKLLSDFITIVQTQVQTPTQATLRMISESRAKYDFVLSAIANSTASAKSANVSLTEARRLLEIAKTALIESAVQFGLVPRLQQDLDAAAHQLEIKRSILSRLNPKYTDQYVKPCISHVDDLRRRLQHLIGLFNATREVSEYPMQAATVYQKIVAALTEAETAARRAFDAGERAYREAYPGSDDALVRRASEAKARSYQLLDEARELRNSKVPELERDLAKKRYLLESLKGELSSSTRNLELIISALESLPKGLGRTIKETDTFLRQILQGLSETHSRIDIIDQKIREQLMPKLEKLNEGSASGLENLTRIIEKARSDIRSASRYATNSEVIADRVNRLHEHVSLDLKELKDRILLARQKASGVKVSLGTDYPKQECVRSFKPDIQPSTSNSIVLNYAIKDEARDALLFFISSASTDDFMAVEMVDRKIRFLWNAGGGTQVLAHNLIIETNDPHLLKDNQWYTITVTRVGNVATLKVMRTPDAHDSDPNEVTGSSPPNYNRMNLDSTAFFYVGGLPSDFRAPRELRTRKFAGCMYEVSLDGRRIGLWNFRTNFGCRGCKEGASEPRDPSTFSFTGSSSYAVLPQIKRYDKRKNLIVMQFRTFDEESLLFFCSNPITGDFVAIMLRGGKLVYQFNMGTTSTLSLVSRLKYNTGQWVRLAAERDKLEGILSVDDELLEGKVPAAGPMVLELSDAMIYYGGVPPNFSSQSWPSVTFKPFFGCMKDLQVDTTPLGLLNADSYGVDTGCRDRLANQIVSFTGPGSFIELRSVPLREEADFAFTFRTSQSDALLLLSTFQGQSRVAVRDSHYYSVAIVGGHLEARFNGGSGETPLISEIKVNDGDFHTVSLSKRHRRIAMTLDDVEIGASRMAKGTKDIEAPPDGGLFLGGVPRAMSLRGMAGTKESLRGVIQDLVFNRKSMNLNEPVNFEKIGIGRELVEKEETDNNIFSVSVNNRDEKSKSKTIPV